MKPSYSQSLSARIPRAPGAIAKATRTLEDMALQREKARATESRTTAKAMGALRAAFEETIAESPAATRALEALGQESLKPTPARVRESPPRAHGAASMLLSLWSQEHLSVATPPYDFDWQRGNALDSGHNRITGGMFVTGASGEFHGGVGASGRVDAAAGIGLALTTDAPVVVSVRPIISYSWNSLVAESGFFSHGEARGGLDAAAFLNGAIIAGVRRTEVFSESRGSLGIERNEGNGDAYVPDLMLGFKIDPGQIVIVNFGVWVECDHNSFLGWGSGSGTMNATVSMIFVERVLELGHPTASCPNLLKAIADAEREVRAAQEALKGAGPTQKAGFAAQVRHWQTILAATKNAARANHCI